MSKWLQKHMTTVTILSPKTDNNQNLLKGNQTASAKNRYGKGHITLQSMNRIKSNIYTLNAGYTYQASL